MNLDNKNKDISYKTVTLTLTEDCNLSCSYCYEHNKSCRSMPLDLAKKIILKELDNVVEDEIHFELFGGEPFLEFDKIVSITKFLCECKPNKKYLIFTTTNGTLVHGEIQNWLKEHAGCFICGLSLDGTKFMHDINRSNSFDDIDIDFFAKTYPTQPIKMTISEETLPFLFEGVKFCHEKNFQVNCNLAFGINWSGDNSKILEIELNKLIEYYLENPDIVPCSMLGNGISQLGYDHREETTRKWCGVGTHMHTYDVDGEKYPCQFFMPLSVGSEKAIAAQKIKFSEEIEKDKLDNKCRTCIAADACPTCYGSNYMSSGNLFYKDDNYCLLTKITLRARSYLMAKKWERGLIDLKGNEEQLLLRSIYKIQNDILI